MRSCEDALVGYFTRSDKVCIVGKLECMLPLKHRSIFFPVVLSFLHLFASERDHLFGRCFCQDELHFPSLSLEGDRRSSSVPFHGNFCHLFPSYPDTFLPPATKPAGLLSYYVDLVFQLPYECNNKCMWLRKRVSTWLANGVSHILQHSLGNWPCRLVCSYTYTQIVAVYKVIIPTFPSLL